MSAFATFNHLLKGLNNICFGFVLLLRKAYFYAIIVGQKTEKQIRKYLGKYKDAITGCGGHGSNAAVALNRNGSFESIRQQQWDYRVYICGDFESEIADDNPSLAMKVGIVSNMQTNLALEQLLKMKK